MARKPRKSPQAEFHHLTNRGARRNPIYFDDWDRQYFLELIAGANERYGIVVHAYALMGNHYHLVAQFPDRNMSQVMHWIGGCFASTINRKYVYDGRLCKDRFFNNPIEDDDYFMRAVRYVHRNPLDLGITDLLDYKWSNYRDYVLPATKPGIPRWSRTDLVLGLFGGSSQAYQRFVKSAITDEVDDSAA